MASTVGKRTFSERLSNRINPPNLWWVLGSCHPNFVSQPVNPLKEKFVKKVQIVHEESNEQEMKDDYQFMTEDDMIREGFSELLSGNLCLNLFQHFRHLNGLMPFTIMISTEEKDQGHQEVLRNPPHLHEANCMYNQSYYLGDLNHEPGSLNMVMA